MNFCDTFICSSKEDCEKRFAIGCERGQNHFHQVCGLFKYLSVTDESGKSTNLHFSCDVTAVDTFPNLFFQC